jgi:coenzyme F420-reducing hydrogenase alpha subunit
LEDETLTRTDTRVKTRPREGKGIGIVEAPRGTLAHEYSLNKYGKLQDMKLIIPTQVNNAAINLNVKDAAKEFIHLGEVKPGLLNRIEMIIRAYDPCIKCATRSIGRGLIVEIRNNEGEVVQTLRR